MADREVDVLVRLADADVLAGRLWCHRRRGLESQTFRYASEYVRRPGAYELDPLLPLVEGAQQTPANRAIFGAFSDSAPDRWGRRLIGRAERRRARRIGDTARSFGEADYLLGVRDDLRQGAVRFGEPGTGDFLAPPDTGVPSLLDLPTLLGAGVCRAGIARPYPVDTPPAERLERTRKARRSWPCCSTTGSTSSTAGRS